jgi:hypothetical protein
MSNNDIIPEDCHPVYYRETDDDKIQLFDKDKKALTDKILSTDFKYVKNLTNPDIEYSRKLLNEFTVTDITKPDLGNIEVILEPYSNGGRSKKRIRRKTKRSTSKRRRRTKTFKSRR